MLSQFRDEKTTSNLKYIQIDSSLCSHTASPSVPEMEAQILNSLPFAPHHSPAFTTGL